MRTYDSNQPIIYTHIPKCAGSSMRRVLSNWFGDGFHKVNQQQNSQFGMQKLQTQDADGNWLPNVRCIQGHFHHGHGFGLPYFYPEIKQYVTILRDPFDLLVSMYFFMKGRSRRGQFWYRGRPVDISEAIPSVQAYLSKYPYWLFSHLPQDITLANYREKLTSQFVYIGVFEDMQSSIDRLAVALGQSTMTLPMSNVSEYDERVPEELREQFYVDYPLPKKIYDFAVENYLNDPTPPTDEDVNSDVIPEAETSGDVSEIADGEVVCGDMLMSEGS